jgi:hypothetical protein
VLGGQCRARPDDLLPERLDVAGHKPWYLDPVLRRTRNLASWSAGTATITQYGSSDIPLATFTSANQSIGSWTHAYYTEP